MAVPLVTGNSDAAVIADIAERLRATGEFAEVSRNRPFEAKGQWASDRGTAADVSPASPGEDLDTSDDYADVTIEHRARCTVTIAVREEDEATRFNLLDRLANLARNTLNGESLAGATIPGHTLARRFSYPAAEPPEQRVMLVVEYETLVDGFKGFDTALVN